MAEWVDLLLQEIWGVRRLVILLVAAYGTYFRLTRVPFDVWLLPVGSACFITWKNTSNRLVPRKAYELKVRVLDAHRQVVDELDYEEQPFDAGDQEGMLLPESAEPPFTIEVEYICWRRFPRRRSRVLDHPQSDQAGTSS